MKTNKIKELKTRALAGDLSALEELRQLGVLSGDKLKYTMAPVSYAQRRLWFIDKMDHSPAYNLPATLVLEGNLHVEALENAFSEIIRRHEILRTCFIESDGIPYQKIFSHSGFNLEFTDLTNEPLQQEKIQSFIQDETNRCFNLSQTPLFTCRLLKVQEAKHLLLFNMHHIISDGWSIGVLISELTLLYNSFCKGLSNPLPPLKFQYKDYVRQQDHYLNSDEAGKHKEYWLKKLSGTPEVTELPADLIRPRYKTFNGRLHIIEIEEPLHLKISEWKGKANVSLFMLLVAAVNILLNKYTGKRDFTLGSAISGREQKNTADQIGFYVNTIPLRNEMDVSVSFRHFLEQVKRNCIEAYENQFYPFDLLIEDLKPERDTSRNPLFEIMISLQESEDDSFPFEGITTTVIKPEITFSKMDLHFNFEESEEGMRLNLIYNPDLYSAQRITRMGKHFLQMLKNLLNFPGKAIGSIEIITESEKQQILQEFNDTRREFPKNKTIATLFEEIAEKYPGKDAVVYQGRPVSYSRLNEKADILASVLQRQGLKVEEPVAILMERSHELMVSILAVLKSGGAYLPIDTKFPENRIQTILEDAGIRILLTDGSRNTDFAVPGCILVDEKLFENATRDKPAKPEKTSSGLAYILYTSGSTGKPKGSMIEEKSVIRLVRNTNYTKFSETDRIFSTSSVSFDATTMDIWGALLNGGTLYLENTEDYLDPEKLKEYFSNYGITKALIPTGLFSRMLESDLQQNLRLFEGIKEIFVGGDTFPPRMANLFVLNYPGVILVNVYGPTENTCFTTSCPINHIIEEDIPVGKPISNTTVYILDGQNNLCPVGIPGELCTGGEGVSRGYVNRPDLDRICFMENPFVPGEKLYRTGDMAQWDENGHVHFLGRNDDQLKIRGYRIETGEIENTAQRCEGISQAKVLVIHEMDQKQLALYFTTESQTGNVDIRDFLSRSLPGYMIPDYFIRLKEFPLNQNGKIDMKALPKPEDQEKPAFSETHPPTLTEKILVKIYKELLNIKSVPLNASFFSLGGHSLSAIRIVSAIQKELSVKISLKEFFHSPDIVSLGRIIQNKKKEVLGNIPVVPEAAYYPLSHAQKRLWVLDKIERSKSTYNIPLAVSVSEEIKLDVLQAAFDDLIQRHEVLRTIFIEINGTPYQKLLDTGRVPIQTADFSESENPEAEAFDFLVKEAHRPFTLSGFPLVRLYVISVTPGKHILFLNIHHIICDGWSLDILVNELFMGYGKHLKNDPGLAEKLPIQYKDYAAWLNQKTADPESQEERNYWLQKLGGAITPLDLPSDFVRPAVKTYEGDSLWFSIPGELKVKMEAFCAEKRISLFMMLAAALKVLLYRYSSKEDIVIGTPVSGRNHPDLENQIGYYSNTLALRDLINPDKTFAAFFDDIKETATEAYSHQMYPFDKLVEELKLPRDTSRSPLFDVMMVYQNSDYSSGEFLSFTETVHIPMKISKFDLTFNFSNRGDQLDLLVEYNTHLYRKERIEQMASHLQILTGEVLSNPMQSLRSIPVLSKSEKENLLVHFNNTRASYPEEKTISVLFEEAVVRYPSNIAVIYNEKYLTYEELNGLAEKMAVSIAGRYQIKRGEPIGVLLSPSEKMIAVLLAILKVGGAYVPVDPEYPGERIKHILSESNMKLVVAENSSEARLRAICEDGFPDCTVITTEQLEQDTPIRNNPLPASPDPDTTAYVIFTSGSTGKPKGCPVSHRNLVRLFVNDRSPFDFGPSDTWIMAHSYCFDFSVWEMYGALLFGGKLIVPDRHQVRDIASFTRLVSKHQVTVLNQTPGAFYKFIDTAHELHEYNLKLRYIIFGGDKLNPSKLRKWITVYPSDKVSLINMYGITETTIHVTFHRLTDEEILHNDGSSNIGSPLPGTRVYILDEALQPVPTGIYGEIYVSGSGLCGGYLNRPDLTAERFLRNPFESGSLMYKSGDIGRWLFDGSMEYLDRADNQVQIRGYRVETAEIEMQLRKHPSITDTVVVGIEREGTKELAAYLVMKESLTVNEIKTFLSALLPVYMIPSFFIQIDKIPLTTNGKLDKKALPAAVGNIESGAGFQKPETETEAILLQLWQEVLTIENISIYDNFFDIGGNSILLVKLHGKINERFPGVLEITDLFSNSKISEQAIAISQKYSKKDDPLVVQPEPETGKWHDIAIVGMASRIGPCETPEDFWKELCKGTDFIGPIPDKRIPDIRDLAIHHDMTADKLKFREYCYLPEVDLFDYGFFKLSPAEASLIDPGQRLFLETACHAMEDAGYGGTKLWGCRTGVFIGTTGHLDEYSQFVEAGESPDPNLLLAAQTPSILASRLSYHFNLKGPALLVDTACSSSLVALHLACQSLREGRIDAAIVGGAKLHLLPFDSGTRMEIDSDDGRAHVFDDSANGTAGGEGVIAIMIKPLEHAIKDRDPIYAVIKGSAINQDGNSNGITAPDAGAQADVIDSAWKDAGIDPRTVGFIETHGTGTKLGDPIEIDGITNAFRRYTSEKNFCALGAVKANIGHLDAIAGLAGVVKAVLSLKHKKLTPLVHFNKPNRNIHFDESAAFINKDLTDWNKGEMPRRCGVSSFGLSGTNCHVVLEEAPAIESISSGKESHLFVLSSRSREGLWNYLQKTARFLHTNQGIDSEDLCYTLATGRGHHACRLAILFRDENELKEKLARINQTGILHIPDENIYFQNIRIVPASRKELLPNEVTEHDIREISREINELIAVANSPLEKRVAEAYVRGANITWEDYFAPSAPSRVSLPGYPFEKKRCWVQLKMKKTAPEFFSGTYGKNYKSFFLNRCILDTPAAAVYSYSFNPGNWLVDEHRVQGQPTLVGVAYLQMAWEAGRNHFNSDSFRVLDLFLLQPLVIEENELEILISVNKLEEYLEVRIHSRKDESNWQEYARVKITPVSASLENQLDIRSVRNRMPLSRTISFREEPRSGEIVQVSQKWDILRKVWWNENEHLAELSVPQEDETLASGFHLYPPLMDAALSFAMDTPGFLPWSFGTVEILRKAGTKLFSYVSNQRKTSDTRTYDITLAGEDGQIVATFKDFTLKRAFQPKTLFHELVWKSWPLQMKPVNQTEYPVVLFTRNSAPEMVKAFQSAGAPMVEIAHDQYATAFPDGLPEKLVYLLPEFEHEDNVEEQLDASLYCLFRFAKYLSSQLSAKLDLLLVGMNVMEVNGDERCLNSLLHPVAGLGQVIGQENPRIRCRFLDADEHTSVSAILDEVRSGIEESYYYRSVRKGERFIREIKPVHLNGLKPEKLNDGLYVITGGTGGIGLELAKYMADNARVELALLNRSVFPPREQWDQLLKERANEKWCIKIEKIQAIENTGAKIYLFDVDVADFKALQQVFEKIKELGTIRGVIHAAGLPGEGMIHTKELNVFRQTIKPKIAGTINLARLLQNIQPDFFLLTSALTAILPTAGQSDYTAANCFQDAFCYKLRRQGLNARSINLTAWKETGMAFDHGVTGDGVFKSITPGDAVAAIGRMIQSDKTSVILGETDLSRLEPSVGLPFYLDHTIGTPEKSKPKAEPEGAILLSGRENGNYSDCEKAIAETWGNVLGYTELNIHDNYYDLGGDSIHAIKISSMLEKQKLPVSIGDLFNYLTIAELAAFLESKTVKTSTSERSHIVPAEKSDRYPVSAAQRRLFILDQLTTDKLSYHIPEIWNIKGELNTESFKNAFYKLAERHEILRTSFDLAEDLPVQIIHDTIDFNIPVLRMTEEKAMEYIRSFIQPFELNKAPLFRTEIIEMAADRHLVLFDAHHIIIDAFSMEILRKELFGFYAGKIPEPLKIQYKDYANWQNNMLQQEEIKKQKAWWLDQFREDVPAINLPLDFPRLAGQPAEAGVVSFALDESLTARIKKMSADEGLSTFMILFSAYQILMHKYTQQEDIVTGVTTMGRNRDELMGLLGMFVNNLPVRAFPKAGMRVHKFMDEVRKNLTHAFANQDYPFDELVENLKLKRDLNRSPLFDIVFSYMNFGLSEIRTNELEISDYKAEKILSSEYDLMLYGLEAQDKIYITVKYKKALFKKESIERLAGHFVKTAGFVAGTHPSSTIADLELPLPEEMEKFSSCNQGYEAVGKDVSVFDLLRVVNTPDKTAVVCNGRSMTFAELNAKSNQLANYLRRAFSVKFGDRIGIMLGRDESMVVAMLGILKSGASYIGIDPEYPRQRVDYILGDSRAKVLVTSKAMYQQEIQPGLRILDIGDPLLKEQSCQEPKLINTPEDPAYVIYTSGSTGQPKGVVITHKNLSVFLQWCLLEFSSTPFELLYATSSYCFDLSVFEIFYPLIAGKTIRVLKSSTEIMRWLGNDDKVLINTVPSLLNVIIDEMQEEHLARLAGINLAGEQIPQALMDAIDCNRFEVRNLYGPSEDTTYSTIYRFSNENKKVLIGKPISNTQIFITDSGMKLVPFGHPGEICISGDGLAKGYLFRDELTSEKFISNPFGNGRLYRTGDLGRWTANGNLEYLGRIDRQVKIRGFRVELGEIETHIRRYPGIENAVVVAKEIKGVKDIVAYLVTSPDVIMGNLKAYLGKIMPAFMVPLYFVVMDQIPLTPNGKADVAALPDPVIGSHPQTEAVAETLDASEKKLADIWKEVLDVEHLSKYDSFFDLGGHSLKALRLLAKINRAFGQQCALSDIFEHPSVAGFAVFLKSFEKGNLHQLTPLPKAEYYEVSHAQRRMWTFNRIEKNSAVYNIPVVFSVKSILNETALEEAFKALIKKHESLRTCFVEIEGDPKQVILDEVDFNIGITEIDGGNDLARSSSGLIRKFITTPFNLESAPLIRVKLIKNLHTTEYLLVINIHHIVLDEWSIDILLRHLSEFYDHFASINPVDDEHTFHPSPVQYKEFACWQNSQIEHAIEHRDYWLRQFKEPAPALDLPADFPRPKVQTFEGRTLKCTLPAELSEGLRKLSAANQSTLFITSLALFHVLFSKYTGQDDVVIGTPVSNRDHPDVQDQIGFFLNTLALRNRSIPSESFKSFLKSVKEKTLTSFSHQLYPFDLLVDNLELNRDLSRSPLFDVMLISQSSADNNRKSTSGLILEPMEIDYPLSKFDLSISYYPDEDGIHFFFEYNTSLFRGIRIRNLFNHFVSLVEKVLADDETPIHQLDIISSEEKATIIQFSKGPEHVLKNRSVISMIENQVAGNGDKTAVVYKRRKLTYNELNVKANRLARLLADYNIGQGDFVCVMADRSEWSVIALLAILKAGAVYVPIDPSYPQSRIEYMLQDSRCKLMITSGKPSPVITPDLLQMLETTGLDARLLPFSPGNPETEVTADQDSIAYVIYTSGSTGQPKGILGTHRCLLNLVEWQSARIERNLKTLQYAPHSFDVSIQEILFALATGGILYLIDNETRYNMQLIAEIVEKESIEILTMPFSGLNLLLSVEEDLHRLGSLRHLITSGEQPFLNDPVNKLLKMHPSLQFHNQYGPSETHVVTSYTVCSDHKNLPVKIPAGRPVNNTQIYLLNHEMQMVPVGIAGALYIGGHHVAYGYLNRPDLTSQCFVDNPFGAGKLYKSGDLARWNFEGELEFLGRNDQQVKVRGFRIELEEISSCLQKHPDVREAVVRLTGFGESKEIAAYYTTTGEVNSADLKNFLSNLLPGYMIPAYLVRLESFPLTPSGKVDQLSLPEPLEQSGNLLYEEPEGETEKAIAEVWMEILKQEKISATDGFFEMGGNSIKAIRLMSKVQKRLSKKIHLNLIFEHPTIRQMALIIDKTDETLKNLADDFILMNPGQERKIFFMPPGIGYSFAYMEFAKYLEHYCVCGLNFIESKNPVMSMTDILEDLQKEGAFYLFGHSAGGNMAFDVALELQKRGRAVGGLILLDCYRQVEVIDWSEEEYLNDAVLYIEQNHAEFLEEAIKDAALQKIIAYRRYLNARSESDFLSCPVIQVAANDEITVFGRKISREAWGELCPQYEVLQGFGGHMDMLKQPNLEKNALLTDQIMNRLINNT
jgi:surfactin family lipopeptide synthetase A